VVTRTYLDEFTYIVHGLLAHPIVVQHSTWTFSLLSERERPLYGITVHFVATTVTNLKPYTRGKVPQCSVHIPLHGQATNAIIIQICSSETSVLTRGTQRRHIQEDSIFHFPLVFLRIVRPLLVTSNVVPSSQILVTLMMVELGSSETSVLTSATRRNIPEDTILHSHRRKKLKSYIVLTDWVL
jgi:hypothetical protein